MSGSPSASSELGHPPSNPYKRRLALAALGLSIGTGLFTLTASLLAAYGVAASSGLEKLGKDVVFVYGQISNMTSQRESRPLAAGDVDLLRERLGSDAEVEGLYAVTGSVTACGESVATSIMGVTSDYEAVANLKLAAPRFLLPSEVAARERVVVLTDTLVKRFKCHDLSKVLVSGQPFMVVGTISGLPSLGQASLGAAALMPTSTFLRVYGHGVPLSRIVVKPTLRNGSDVTSLIRPVLREAHRLPPLAADDFRIETSADLIESGEEMRIQLTVLAAVLLSGTLIAALVGLLNSTLMTVVERTHEIGIRRAVGATRRAIAQQFLLEGFGVGLAGSALGALLGLVVATLVETVVGLPKALAFREAFAAITVGSACCVLVSTIPALKAASVNIIEAVERR